MVFFILFRYVAGNVHTLTYRHSCMDAGIQQPISKHMQEMTRKMHKNDGLARI